MSAITVARVETKIQSFVLGPLWFCFLAGALVSIYHAAWWVAGVHVLLCFYIGWIGKNLGIHRGKSFGELSQGVLVVPPALTPDEPDDLSSEEMRHLVNTMQHVLYAVILAAATMLLVAGTKFYWVLLIGVVLLFVGLPIIGAVVGLMSVNRLALRRKSDDDASQKPSANP
jgi:hypothetical protein